MLCWKSKQWLEWLECRARGNGYRQSDNEFRRKTEVVVVTMVLFDESEMNTNLSQAAEMNRDKLQNPVVTSATSPYLSVSTCICRDKYTCDFVWLQTANLTTFTLEGGESQCLQYAFTLSEHARPLICSCTTYCSCLYSIMVSMVKTTAAITRTMSLSYSLFVFTIPGTLLFNNCFTGAKFRFSSFKENNNWGLLLHRCTRVLKHRLKSP